MNPKAPRRLTKSVGVICGILLSGIALAEPSGELAKGRVQEIASAEPIDWRAMAIADIEAAYEAFKQEHPGYYDPANPAFREQLEQARERGLEFANRITKPEHYAVTLTAFSSVLRDGHALVYPANAYDKAVSGKTISATSRWPGFIANWRGSGMLVTKALPKHQSLVGAQVIECDGQPVLDLIERNVFALRYRPDEPGQWWSQAHNLFIDSRFGGLDMLDLSPPARCVFEQPGGTRETKALEWSEVPEQIQSENWFYWSWVGALSYIGLTEPRPGLFVIGLPSFSPEKDEEKAAYEKLFADLAARHSDLAKARAIFIDMRGNNGGSSTWPKRVAQLLWGDEYIDPVMDKYHSAVRIHWRNTPAVRERVKLYSGLSELPDYYKSILAELAKTMNRSDPQESPLVVEPKSPDDVAKEPAPPLLADIPVYVASDGSCASACNNGLDVFTRFPGTRLIGAPSSADSTYLEVRYEDTPSGYARMVLPMKIWVNRPVRPGPADTYPSDIPVTSADWSTERFLDLIEQDLAARRESTK